MVKHAILLASEEWCEEASKGRIKIYHFIKPRRRSIRALEPDSVCVVLTKKQERSRLGFTVSLQLLELERLVLMSGMILLIKV